MMLNIAVIVVHWLPVIEGSHRKDIVAFHVRRVEILDGEPSLALGCAQDVVQAVVRGTLYIIFSKRLLWYTTAAHTGRASQSVT